MMSAFAGSYTESWLVGDISGRSTFCSCDTATCCPMATWVTICSPPRGGASRSFTGAAAFASATGMMRTAPSGPSTAVKPCAFKAERNTWKAAATGMGRAETIVTWPLTRGSTSTFRPVICDIAFTTACRSADWKLSSTSPDRGAARIPAGDAADGGGGAAGAAGSVAGGGEGATGASAGCGAATWAPSASRPAKIRGTVAEMRSCLMSAKNSASPCPSTHIVVERLGAALALHVHENALGAAELLVEPHHVVHVGDRLAVDVADHVAGTQAQLLVEAPALHLAHEKPAAAGVRHDQRLAQEFRPAELLLQLAPIDPLPVGAERLHDRRHGGDCGPRRFLRVFHEHRFARAAAHDHDAVAQHALEARAGNDVFPGAIRRLGLALHDHERAAAGGAHDDARQRDVQVAAREARIGRGIPRRGRGGAPEGMRVRERAQVGEIRATGARDRRRARLHHAPGPLREPPAQRKERGDRRRDLHRAVGEHGLDSRGGRDQAVRERCRRLQL